MGGGAELVQIGCAVEDLSSDSTGYLSGNTILGLRGKNVNGVISGNKITWSDGTVSKKGAAAASGSSAVEADAQNVRDNAARRRQLAAQEVATTSTPAAGDDPIF